MKPDLSLLSELKAVPWLRNCGAEPPRFPFRVRQLGGWTEVREACEAGWFRRTENAQGALTEYLSLRHPASYQGVWNRLIKEVRPVVEATAGRAARSLAEAGAMDLAAAVNWDVLNAVMECSYRSLNPPRFFDRLLEVYRAGHFPCGGDDDGTMLIF